MMRVTIPYQTRWTLNLYSSLFGSFLLVLGAWIKIPFYPISFTLHTLVLYFLSLTQSPKQASASAGWYLLFASLGLPVFAGHGDGAWWMGKCAGYFLSFPISAYLIATLRDKVGHFFASVIGSVLLLFLGFLGLIPFVGVFKAWMYGFVIFIPCEWIKIEAAIRMAQIARRQ